MATLEMDPYSCAGKDKLTFLDIEPYGRSGLPCPLELPFRGSPEWGFSLASRLPLPCFADNPVRDLKREFGPQPGESDPLPLALEGCGEVVVGLKTTRIHPFSRVGDLEGFLSGIRADVDEACPGVESVGHQFRQDRFVDAERIHVPDVVQEVVVVDPAEVLHGLPWEGWGSDCPGSGNAGCRSIRVLRVDRKFAGLTSILCPNFVSHRILQTPSFLLSNSVPPPIDSVVKVNETQLSVLPVNSVRFVGALGWRVSEMASCYRATIAGAASRCHILPGVPPARESHPGFSRLRGTDGRCVWVIIGASSWMHYLPTLSCLSLAGRCIRRRAYRTAVLHTACGAYDELTVIICEGFGMQ